MFVQALFFLLFLLLFLITSFAFPVGAATEETSADTHRFKQLHEYALLANAAYLGKSDVEEVLTKNGFELTASGELPGFGVSYYLATNDAPAACVKAHKSKEDSGRPYLEVTLLSPNWVVGEYCPPVIP